MSDFYFGTYNEWRDALTIRCGIALTPEYAAERVAALKNPTDSSTSDFLRCYGEAYRYQVVKWFGRSIQEA